MGAEGDYSFLLNSECFEERQTNKHASKQTVQTKDVRILTLDDANEDC